MQRVVRWLFLVGAGVLLALACWCRARGQLPFEDIRTHAHSAKNLLPMFPDPSARAFQLLAPLVASILKAWGPGELLFVASLGLLLHIPASVGPPSSTSTAIILPEGHLAPQAQATALAATDAGSSSNAPSSHTPSWVFFAAPLALLTTLTAWWLGTRVFFNTPHCGDEFAYLFQARVFGMGLWTLPAPVPPDYFPTNNILLYQGQWFAIYPPGWPLLLALGETLGLTAWVNPLAAGLSLCLLFDLGSQLFSKRAGALSVLLVALSPTFTMTAASYMVHPTQIMLTLGTLCLFVRMQEDRPGALLVALACGLVLGACALVRFVECALLVGLLVVWQACLGMRSPYHKLRLFITLTSALLVASWLLVGNLHQSGHALSSGYSLQYGHSLLDLGAHQHSVGGALLNLVYCSGRMLLWQCPLLFELFILGLLLRSSRCEANNIAASQQQTLADPSPASPTIDARWLLGFYLLETVLAFACFFDIGQIEYGARYYLCAWTLGSLIAGHGADEWLKRRGLTLSHLVAPGLLVTLFVCCAAWPGFVREARTLHEATANLDQWLRATAGPHALVFVRATPDAYAAMLTRNLPNRGFPSSPGRNYEGPLRVLFLEPERNQRLRQRYADRPACILDFNPEQQAYRLLPFDEQMRSPDPTWNDTNLLVAGINYQNCLDDPEQALRLWSQIAPDRPGHLAAWYNRIRLEYRLRHWKQVIELAQGKNNPPDLSYMVGRSWLALGQPGEALRELTRAARLLREDAPQGDEVRAWLARCTH